MKQRRRTTKYIQSRDEVIAFCTSFTREHGFNVDRVEDLVEVVWDAVFTSASGQISARKATSLALRFFGNALDVV